MWIDDNCESPSVLGIAPVSASMKVSASASPPALEVESTLRFGAPSPPVDGIGAGFELCAGSRDRIAASVSSVRRTCSASRSSSVSSARCRSICMRANSDLVTLPSRARPRFFRSSFDRAIRAISRRSADTHAAHARQCSSAPGARDSAIRNAVLRFHNCHATGNHVIHKINSVM